MVTAKQDPFKGLNPDSLELGAWVCKAVGLDNHLLTKNIEVKVEQLN